MHPAVVFCIVLLVMAATWWFARSMDAGRIEAYLRGRGCKLQSQKWQPFGRGWFGSTHERIYEIQYEDRDGAVREALAKTSLLAGVYLSDDRIVRPSTTANPLAPKVDVTAVLAENERLLAETHRLRAEIEQLRGGS